MRTRSRSLLRFQPLVLAGLALLALGALADLSFHVLAPALPSGPLVALVGADGVRAHLLTLLGMVVAVCGLVQQGRSTPPG
jgi:hypothetical protein